ncbi:YcxB family protein [Exiguobacterium sp. SH5S13]|uniref:YcxB family protein n=1 Tax=unclassified Exiguobacterium TaxID=2644629 RepID=UPI001039EFBF|nr:MULTISPECIES: YcxB family protein [unclassified Exiguobacterium]TCI24838.1 YcxB family protein [Exiguobacterium sp. SH5S4]TCI49929.1 YcxB family protein [Exiguobacterium sp. SH5S13]
MDTKYQLTFEDFMALQKDSLKRTEHHKARYNITTIALAMMVFLFGFIVLHIILPMSLYFYSLYLNSENIFKLIVVCLAIIPVILLRPFIGKYYDFVTLRKLKSAYKNDTRWPRDVTLQLDETGVHVSSSFKSGIKKTDVPWDSIKVVGEDDGHFFLYYETNEAIIVPKIIPTLNESENIAFYDLIEQRLNNDFKKNGM